MLKSDECPEFPFYSGTGFFVVFPPYEWVFFVTARHCIFSSDDKQMGHLQIPWRNSEGCKEAVYFSDCLTAKTRYSGELFEDVCVFVVGDMPQEELLHLSKRALRLQHQDNVDIILREIDRRRENLRIVGFPGCSKEINYDAQRAIATPRGIYGKIMPNSLKRDEYEVHDLNWTDGELNGFSGSPVLSLHPTLSDDVTPVVVGVVVRGSSRRFAAVNINVATSLIAAWIVTGQSITID